MSEFNRETVLTAARQAAEAKGWHYVGPQGEYTNCNGEHCLVGEILAMQGRVKLPEYGTAENRTGLNIRSLLRDSRVECGPGVVELLKKIMALQDTKMAWGDVVEAVQ